MGDCLKCKHRERSVSIRKQGLDELLSCEGVLERIYEIADEVRKTGGCPADLLETLSIEKKKKKSGRKKKDKKSKKKRK